MRRSLSWIGIASTAVALMGCTATATTESNPQTSSTRVPRHVDESTRPQVAFDPCLDIPDEALLEAGYDRAVKRMPTSCGELHLPWLFVRFHRRSIRDERVVREYHLG